MDGGGQKSPQCPLCHSVTGTMLSSVLLLYRQGDVLACRHGRIVIATVPKGECRAASKTWHDLLNMKNQNAKIIPERGKNGHADGMQCMGIP